MNSQGATEFEPSIERLNEDNCVTLLIYLPGFVKEQLRIQLRSRTLIISGQRKLNDNTWTRFRKEFHVSEDCDVKKISAKFEGSILYVKQPKSTPPVAKQEENRPMNTPTPTLENEPKTHQENAQVKPDSKLDGSEKDTEEKDEISEGKVGEAKEAKGVCENASKKMAGGSNTAMKLKLSRNDVLKFLALVLGFVVGVYCTKSIQSWIA